MNFIKINQVFLRYIIVGSFGTLIDFFIFYTLFNFFLINYLLSTFFAFLFAASFNFIFNKIWTFKVKSSNYRKLIIKFFIVSIIGLLLSTLFMFLFVDQLKMNELFSKILVSSIVIIWNFLANKLWTFKKENNKIFKNSNFKYELSIVIPAYNEEKRIKKTIEKILLFFTEENKESNIEIIIINDGSKDETKNVINNFKNSKINLISCNRNHGKGFAIKKGIESANGKYILMTDADLSTPINQYEKLVKYINHNEIVIGSRYINKNSIKIKQPFYRIAIGRIGNFLIRLFLLDDIYDTQCGFKLFQNVAAKKIFDKQKVLGFGFDMEILLIAKNMNFKIKEVSVDWLNSTDSRLRPIRDSLITFFAIFYIKINLWMGRYK